MTTDTKDESSVLTIVIVALVVYTVMIILATIGVMTCLQVSVRVKDMRKINLVVDRNRKYWKENPIEVDGQVIFKDVDSKQCRRRQDGKPLGDVYVTSSGERWHADMACVGLGEYRRFCRTPCQLCARDV